MPQDSRRYISRTGVTEGPFTVDELYAMVADQKVPANTLFWSESKKEWKLIAGIMLDIDPDQLEQFAKAGVKEVRVIGSGLGDCMMCASLVGKVFPIDALPVLPPVRCFCVPWCRLVIGPVQG